MDVELQFLIILEVWADRNWNPERAQVIALGNANASQLRHRPAIKSTPAILLVIFRDIGLSLSILVVANPSAIKLAK